MNTFISMAVQGVRQLQPYQPGKPIDELEREFGIGNIVKLASNENPLGPSPLALKAIQSAPLELSRYPDGNGHNLKMDLGERLGVNPGQITLGNGSSDVLDIISRVFLGQGREAVFSEHAFAMYPILTQAVGATARIAPALGAATEMHYGHDLEAMRNLIGEQTRIVFIANPNNPTGTFVGKIALENFIADLPTNVVCVVDEAYFEYVDNSDYPDSLDWLCRFPNLIVTRTFSKAYGLAGLRIGYGVSNLEIADLLNRVRQPFNVNSVALAAARAAIKDTKHLDNLRALNSRGLIQLGGAMEALGLGVLPSAGNFLCIDLKQSAGPVYDALLRMGVIVRPIQGYGLPNHIRVTVGTQEENRLFIQAMKQVL